MTLADERRATRPAPGTAPGGAPGTAPGLTGSAPASTAPARDRSIDAVRAGLLIVVVALHAVMVGVGLAADGSPALGNALEHRPGFAPASWFVQIMPLFFVVGGFASLHHWRSMRGRGDTPAAYVRARVERLVRPAVWMVGIVAALLATAAVAGLPGELVAEAGFRIGQPLWFLAVYIACSALVPLMTRWHERAPFRAPLVLAAAASGVDAARLATGLEGLGFLNLLFVWLLMRQLGFLLADGFVDRLPASTRIAAAAAAVAALAVCFATGAYSPDMYENLNPPNVTLVLLGVAQLALVSLARPAIARVAARPRIARAVRTLGASSMTVYLWHLPVMVLVAGLILAGHSAYGLPVPDPLSAEWWISRPLWLVAVGLALAPVVRATRRFEGAPASTRERTATPARSALAAASGTVGTGVVLVFGFGALPASLALALYGIALTAGRGSAREPRTRG
ncbi:acyltransferase family protein [Agromyces archimandritae]|uniref:Acyltransferase n=1 Tax=Agromyces archimandritae TaxID=2781962 RepID=A0A975FP80_9MICO|nr:acyltransferase [Agromyces archimandritae]QTX05754.1 acyltransferase [Agromyces archimandritae]